MPKIGDVSYMYGQQFNVAVANAGGSTVMASSNLPKTSVIIAAEQSGDHQDLGIYSIVATDYNGQPGRLTHGIVQGNGLYADQEDQDAVGMHIDGTTIKDGAAGLMVDMSAIVDGSKIQVDSNVASISTDAMQVATNVSLGTVGVDNSSIRSSNGRLYVDTESLVYGHDGSMTYGIGVADGTTMMTRHGVLSAMTSGIPFASSTEYGIPRVDGVTVTSVDGVLAVNEDGLRHATNEEAGLIKPDNRTVRIVNDMLTVDTSALPHATDTDYGTVKLDPHTFEIAEDGTLQVRRYGDMISYITGLASMMQAMEDRITAVRERIARVDFIDTVPMIFAFYSTTNTAVTMSKVRRYNEATTEMKTNTFSAEFIINTNCDFILSMNFENNVTPGVYLKEINLNDSQVFPGESGFMNRFKNTEEQDEILTFVFSGKNYRSSNNEYSTDTRVRIRATSVNDSSIYKEILYTITRFNSLFKPEGMRTDNIETYDRSSMAMYNDNTGIYATLYSMMDELEIKNASDSTVSDKYREYMETDTFKYVNNMLTNSTILSSVSEPVEDEDGVITTFKYVSEIAWRLKYAIRHGENGLSPAYFIPENSSMPSTSTLYYTADDIEYPIPSYGIANSSYTINMSSKFLTSRELINTNRDSAWQYGHIGIEIDITKYMKDLYAEYEKYVNYIRREITNSVSVVMVADTWDEADLSEEDYILPAATTKAPTTTTKAPTTTTKKPSGGGSTRATTNASASIQSYDWSPNNDGTANVTIVVSISYGSGYWRCAGFPQGSYEAEGWTSWSSNQSSINNTPWNGPKGGYVGSWKTDLGGGAVFDSFDEYGDASSAGTKTITINDTCGSPGEVGGPTTETVTNVIVDYVSTR